MSVGLIASGHRPKRLRHLGALNPAMQEGQWLSRSSPRATLLHKYSPSVPQTTNLCNGKKYKSYVACKAEINFVEAMPRDKQLGLPLNMQFHELQDSRGLARNVTNLGGGGNGDPPVELHRSEETP